MRWSGRIRMGYFPLPLSEAQRIHRFLWFPNAPSSALDPCVGDNPAPDGLSAMTGSWSIDCSLGTTQNSAFTNFLRFLIPAKSPTCSGSPRRRILTFWTRAQMGQEDRGQVARQALMCLWRSVSSHGSCLSRPGWSQISWVRMVRCLTQGD